MPPKPEIPDDIRAAWQRFERPPALPDIEPAWQHAEPIRLGPVRRWIVLRIIEAVSPSKQTNAPDVPPTDILHSLERALPYYQRFTRIGYYLAVLGLFWLAFFGVDRRRRIIQSWLTGRGATRRNLMRAVTLNATFFYYDEPNVHRALGYEPAAWFEDRKKARREVLDAIGHPVD